MQIFQPRHVPSAVYATVHISYVHGRGTHMCTVPRPRMIPTLPLPSHF
jgi:hypothetical protein